VAGASLVAIDKNETLKNMFLGISDYVDVVLACRVSPKQKADIVNWIRHRFPKKVTMAIGDGANDVNMILQAHVGVGILGKEGQQAARTADYAIGQFKFLKPLMFIHGREAYRRNSMMVKYSFFKSVMYMLPQFYFGFYSGFSGLVFYEPWIYQMYNIFMTGLPIMYYCLFDFEYAKEEFLKYPNYYRIGMKNACFSYKIFVQWLGYALVVGFAVFDICFKETVGFNQMSENGQKIELWASGNLTYGGSIFVANLVLLYKFNNIDGWNVLFIFSGFAAFFIASALENDSPKIF
jgi:phospholipid-transporting ATPase